ncbi:Gfo/Idh/MocA family protein [Holdemania filiformis]|uniref:Gfo/Idh/MocA family protein n=1 Tax=Holdemania filiformis TaxID=61171 RepID=UPI0024312AF8|nr:Gfo/Idh/MocA family oxidoreductase [Holdemania filiformis]
MLHIAFWGYGSIAKRHIRNLSSILQERKQEYQIDVFRHSFQEIKESDIKKIVNEVYAENVIIEKRYDILFVTNPTSLHFETVKRCVPYTRHMFIEKPVFQKVDEKIETLGLLENSVYYVACPLRYTSVLQYVKNNIALDTVFSVRAISSSYLPDWRPGTDYRNTYSAHKNMGGGVAIDLIHEWDYLTAMFGFPKQVLYAGGRFSGLNIDSDDLAAYIGVYDGRIIELHLDYFGRKTKRELLLYTANEMILANLINSKISFLQSGKIVDLKEDRDEFQKRELHHFLDIVEGKCENDSTIEHGLQVLKIAKNYKVEV